MDTVATVILGRITGHVRCRQRVGALPMDAVNSTKPMLTQSGRLTLPDKTKLIDDRAQTLGDLKRLGQGTMHQQQREFVATRRASTSPMRNSPSDSWSA